MPRRQGHVNGVTFIIIVYQLRSRRWRDPTKNGIYAGYLLKKIFQSLALVQKLFKLAPTKQQPCPKLSTTKKFLHWKKWA
jgi:hypothetical protein